MNDTFIVVGTQGKNPRLTIRSDGSVTLKVPLGEDETRLARFAKYVKGQVEREGFPPNTLRNTLRGTIRTIQDSLVVTLDKTYHEWGAINGTM